MFKLVKSLLPVLLFVFGFLFVSNISFAQDSLNTNQNDNGNINANPATPPSGNENFAVKHAKELQARLNLTDDQTKQVENILSNYQQTAQAPTNNNDNNTSSTVSPDKAQAAVSDKVENVLDSNQKAQFNQVKDAWWASVTRDMGNSEQNQQNNTY